MLLSDLYWCTYRVMNGINAPKVVECLGSDGCRYKQLAKSGNDDLRQDAVRFSTCCLYASCACARALMPMHVEIHVFLLVFCLTVELFPRQCKIPNFLKLQNLYLTIPKNPPGLKWCI